MLNSWASEGVLIVAAEGRIRSANAAAERLLGYGRGELSGLDADKVLDGQHHVTWSRRKSVVLVQQREEPMPQQPPPVAAAAELDSESISLLENELLLVNGLAGVALASLASDDPAREDIEQLTRAAARAAILCREAAPVKPASLDVVPLGPFLDGVASRLRAMVDAEVRVTLHATGTVLANAPLLEQALLSLVLHALPAATVELSTARGGRIEAMIGDPAQGWRRVLGERKLPRAAAWLAAQGAMLEEDIADGGTGHRFRIHLAQPC
jgi:hypothetical protein